MFVGHVGIAQFGKGARRELPLFLLLAAAYLPDLIRFAIEPFTVRHEVFSHSIPVVVALGLAIGLAWLLRGGRPAAAAVLVLVCVLHWPADFFTGCKPTTLHGPWLGLVSYRRPVNDLLVEGALLIGGWLYAKRAGARIGKKWIAMLFAVQIGFLTSMYYGSEFFVGSREWMWKPSESLIPQPHVLEQTPCRPVPR